MNFLLNIGFIVAVICIMQYFSFFDSLEFAKNNNIVLIVSSIYIILYFFIKDLLKNKKEDKNLKFIEKFRMNIENKINEYDTIATIYYLFAGSLSLIFILIIINILLIHFFNITINYQKLFSTDVTKAVIIVILIILFAINKDAFKYKKGTFILWTSFIVLAIFIITIKTYGFSIKIDFLEKTNNLILNLTKEQLNYIFYLFLVLLILGQATLYKKANYYEKILEKFKNKMFYLSILQDYINEMGENKSLNYIFGKNSFINDKEFEKIKNIIFENIIEEKNKLIDTKLTLKK